jgi:succinylarginine dihydrolase
MTRAESDSMHQGVVLTDARYAELVEWVTAGYRDRLCFDDLRNPDFFVELEDLYNKLESILKINQLYNFE